MSKPAIISPNNALPDLYKAEEIPMDLCGTYWTPQEKGESVRGFFSRIESSIYKDKNGDEIELPRMVMAAQMENGEIYNIYNASKRLVSAIEDNILEQRIKEGTPIKITYLGKEKNKTNSHSSDKWSLKVFKI